MIKYIPDDKLQQFLKSFEISDIWQVHQLNSRCLIVFLYFDYQIEANKNLPIYEKMKSEYFRLVKKYMGDAPNSPEEVGIKFDSKEYFETKCDGNWYSYYH